jgi:hypothetical protein
MSQERSIPHYFCREYRVSCVFWALSSLETHILALGSVFTPGTLGFLNSPSVPRVDFQGTSTRTKGRSPSHLCHAILIQGSSSEDRVHLKTVHPTLGCSSITITLDTYSHVLPNMQEKAVEAIEDILDGKD